MPSSILSLHSSFCNQQIGAESSDIYSGALVQGNLTNFLLAFGHIECYCQVCLAYGVVIFRYRYFHCPGVLKSCVGMQMDGMTDRFFRIVVELAVNHCAASEARTVPGAGVLNFMAVDAFVRLSVCLIIGELPPRVTAC